jgi:hypothetical protein
MLVQIWARRGVLTGQTEAGRKETTKKVCINKNEEMKQSRTKA